MGERRGSARSWARAGDVRRRAVGSFDAALVPSVLGVLALVRVGPEPLAVAGAGYLSVVTRALWTTDRRERRLPNALVLPGYLFAGVGVVWSALAGGVVATAPLAPVVCAGVSLVVLLGIASFGGLGMGDVKLGGLLALVLCGLTGAGAVAAAFAMAFVSAGLAALSSTGAGRSGDLHPGGGRQGDLRSGMARDIPFGPFLLASFWAVLLW